MCLSPAKKSTVDMLRSMANKEEGTQYYLDWYEELKKIYGKKYTAELGEEVYVEKLRPKWIDKRFHVYFHLKTLDGLKVWDGVIFPLENKVSPLHELF